MSGQQTLTTDGISTQALLLQSKAAKILHEKKSLTEAVAIFEEAMKIDPNSAVLIVGNSHELFESKQYASCIEACDEELASLEARRHQIEESRRIAAEKLEHSKGQISEATKEVAKGLKETAKQFLMKGKYGEALGVFESWASVEPKNPVPHSNMSLIYQKKSNWELCVTHCNIGIDLCKKHDPEGKEYADILKKLEERKVEADKNVGSSQTAVKVVKYPMTE